MRSSPSSFLLFIIWVLWLDDDTIQILLRSFPSSFSLFITKPHAEGVPVSAHPHSKEKRFKNRSV